MEVVRHIEAMICLSAVNHFNKVTSYVKEEPFVSYQAVELVSGTGK